MGLSSEAALSTAQRRNGGFHGLLVESCQSTNGPTPAFCRVRAIVFEDERDGLGKSQFAFPKQRKEPLEDASHVRNAIARFDQAKDVTDAERDEAWQRIRTAAKKL